jgi:hypothetical protein
VIKAISRGIVSADAVDVRAIADLAFEGAGRSVRFELASGIDLVVTLRDAGGQTWATFAAEPATAPEAEEVNSMAEGRAFLLEPGDLEALQTSVDDLYATPRGQ